MPRGDNFKGKKPEGSGRKAGQGNKLTSDVRAALAAVIQGNTDKFNEMLGKITDPKHFCEVFLKAAEYHIPKLAKVETTIRAPVTAEQMSDDELETVAGDHQDSSAPGIGSPSPSSSTH